jgi:hypothetical protein
MGRSAGGWPHRPCSQGGRLFRLGVNTALAPCNHSLTFVYVDVSMRSHRVKIKRQATHKSNYCCRRHTYSLDYIGPGGRTLHITMLRNDYTVPTRCRHRGVIVDPLDCKACGAIRQPISPSNQILDHSIQKHPKPVSFLSSGVSSGSSLTPLNPTITHIQSPHLASIDLLARFVIIDFSVRNYNRTFCS